MLSQTHVYNKNNAFDKAQLVIITYKIWNSLSLSLNKRSDLIESEINDTKATNPNTIKVFYIYTSLT